MTPTRPICILACSMILCTARPASAQDDRTFLSGNVEIARIVDLAAERRGLDVRYDPSELRGSVTIRVQEGLTAAELWELMQRSLADAGLTTVLEAGQQVVHVVRAQDAQQHARLEIGGFAGVSAESGYASVLFAPEHADPTALVEALKPLLSKPGGSIARLGSGRLIMVGDLVPRLRQIEAVVELLDEPRAEPRLLRLPVAHVPAATLATQVVQAQKAEDTIAGRETAGVVIPGADGSSLLLIAPPDQQDRWTRLVAAFDVPQAAETRSYAIEAFTLEEVATLLEETARIDGARGSGASWRVARDALTNTLVVTATPAEHERIRAALDRLASAPASAKRTTRILTVRNRDAADLLEVIRSLVEQGVLEAEPAGPRPPLVSDRSTAGTTLPFPRNETVLSTDPGREPATRRSEAPQRGEGSTGAASRLTPASPGLTLTIDPRTSSIICLGPARVLDQIESLVAQLDVRQPQVMLEVLVIALTESDLLDLGVELEKIEIAGAATISLQSLFGLSSGGGPTQPTVDRGTGFTGIVLSPGDFSVVIRALQTINDGRSLIRPKILVNNNEQGVLDSVLQEPVQSTNASNTVATTSFAGTQDAGTQVTLRPQIAEGDHLVLQYAVAISEFVGESASPELPPPRQQNTLQSVVTIPDGHTIVLGGIEVRDSSEAVAQIPLLGDIPLVGELFKSRSKTDSSSRLYAFITATILRSEGFEDLRYLSQRDRVASGAPAGIDWPELAPRIIDE
ncbi:MAG: hypothetical protein KF817_00385 [Phycisphaeraceae bacterium]|nr:hypothetical protein [Phycisphaeraceae bacterium]